MCHIFTQFESFIRGTPLDSAETRLCASECNGKKNFLPSLFCACFALFLISVLCLLFPELCLYVGYLRFHDQNILFMYTDKKTFPGSCWGDDFGRPLCGSTLLHLFHTICMPTGACIQSSSLCDSP